MYNVLVPHLVAITAATVTASALGMVWYAPAVFGKRWQKLVGLSAKQIKEADMRAAFGSMFLGLLVLSWTANYVLELTGIMELWKVLLLSTALWMGYGLGTSIGNHAYALRNLELFLIEQGYNLCAVLLVTTIVFML